MKKSSFWVNQKKDYVTQQVFEARPSSSFKH